MSGRWRPAGGGVPPPAGEQWQEAVAGFAAAAELLGLVAPRSLTRGDQEHLLEELGGLGPDAAACCVHAGLTDRAVELFEQGRGVLLGQALDTRTDLTALAEQHPGLAARFTALRDDLDRAGRPCRASGGAAGGDGQGRRGQPRRGGPPGHGAAAGGRRSVRPGDRRDPRSCRASAGFSGRRRWRSCCAAAAEGPVVVVTVSRFGSHALILTGGGVLDPVPLTGLTPDAVYDRVVAFLGALDDAWSPAAGAGGRAAAEQRLGTRWAGCGTRSPARCWTGWASPARPGTASRGRGCGGACPGCCRSCRCTPPATTAHPADAAPATVIDRVISSYTPTIRALTHARRPAPGLAPEEVTGPVPGTGWWRWRCRTPPAPRIFPARRRRPPGSSGVSPAGSPCSPGRRPPMTAVLAALPAGRWAHFACHGASDLSNPSASRLLLTTTGSGR